MLSCKGTYRVCQMGLGWSSRRSLDGNHADARAEQFEVLPPAAVASFNGGVPRVKAGGGDAFRVSVADQGFDGGRPAVDVSRAAVIVQAEHHLAGFGKPFQAVETAADLVDRSDRFSVAGGSVAEFQQADAAVEAAASVASAPGSSALVIAEEIIGTLKP